ncbi:uncharacterized protein LOC108673034 [Hyalella azteca]|uniref:Uncharacterized protein LOC108673034 n=1 Tax=Hyalella azteca TaxID=294128 RepID=A0A8B7NRG6_HYAAZ|nr:uncharacterized protein LOC108673034 [Hyalella azteca]
MKVAVLLALLASTVASPVYLISPSSSISGPISYSSLAAPSLYNPGAYVYRSGIPSVVFESQHPTTYVASSGSYEGDASLKTNTDADKSKFYFKAESPKAYSEGHAQKTYVTAEAPKKYTAIDNSKTYFIPIAADAQKIYSAGNAPKDTVVGREAKTYQKNEGASLKTY